MYKVNLSGISRRMFDDVLFQCLLLSEGQMAPALAVVLQTDEREPLSIIDKAPFRQNGRANVQYLTYKLAIIGCVRKNQGPRPLSSQSFQGNRLPVSSLKCDTWPSSQ